MSKGGDGIFHKRGDGRELIFYWKINNQKSKGFKNRDDCARDYVEKYITRYPKYKELVYDKSWGEIFRMFGI